MYFAAQVKSVNLTFSSGRFYKSSGTRMFFIFHFPIFAISTPKITMSKCKKHVFQFINSTLPSSENKVYNWLLHFPMFAIFTKPTMTRSKFCRKGYQSFNDKVFLFDEFEKGFWVHLDSQKLDIYINCNLNVKIQISPSSWYFEAELELTSTLNSKICSTMMHL